MVERKEKTAKSGGERETSGIVERMEIRRDILRKNKSSIESDIGYWHCVAMTHICEFCSALRYLGKVRKKSGSPLANPKFSECCSSGQVTPHFLFSSSFVHCLRHLETMKAWNVIQIRERLADHADSCFENYSYFYTSGAVVRSVDF